MTKLMSKSELILKVADQHRSAKKDVKSVIELLASVGYKELKKNGAFLLPWICQICRYQKACHKINAWVLIRSRKSRPCSKLDRLERLSGLVR